MPTIRVDLFEGRSPEKKKALIKELTEATVRALESVWARAAGPATRTTSAKAAGQTRHAKRIMR